MSTLLRLLQMGRPSRLRVALSVGLGSLSALAGVGLMALAGYLISRSAEHPPILSLTAAIVAVRALGITRPVARYFERLASHDLALRVLTRMRGAFYRELEPLVPGALGGLTRGDLLARLVGDVDSMQFLFLGGIVPPLVALIVGTVSVLVAAVLLPAAAVALAIGLAAGGLLVPALASLAGRRTGARQASVRAELTAEMVELLRGAPELVVLGADVAAIERIRALDAELTRLARRDALAGAAIEGLHTLVAGGTVAAVLAVSVVATSAGTLDRVFVATLALLALATLEVVRPLADTALRLRTTIAAGRRLLDLTHLEPTVRDPLEPAEPPAGTEVALESVDFDHTDEETWGLRDVRLNIAPGSRVALVGPSGAGKTTVAELLVRFLDPDRGRVEIGSINARDLRQQDVRSIVSLDGQEAYLFATTIRENVRLARPDATQTEIDTALGKAKISDWVRSLPEGSDTFVGEEGAHVSGGERRRIALARTFLAGAPVIVLDEPTAHLDAETASSLVADALGAADGTSVLLITHRAEDLPLVDEVVRLRRGRVSERPSVDRATMPG